jgi:hypothetical protein
MSIVLCLLALGIFALLSYALSVTGRSAHSHLPRDFDFDLYKARELNIRGLFDKTKWN